MALARTRDSRATGGRPGWTIFVLALCHAQAIASFQILNILIEPIKVALTITDTQYSLLQGLAVAIFAAALGLPAARVADRRSRRDVILVGAIGWSLATIACAFVTNFSQLFLARVAMGIGEVFLFPAAVALIADVAPPRRLSTSLALFGCGGPAGGAAALFGGGWIMVHHDRLTAWLPMFAGMEPWRIAFLVCGLTGIMTAALLLTVREPRREQSAAATDRIADVMNLLMRHSGVFAPVSGAMLCLALCAFATSAWLPAVLTRVYSLPIDAVGRLTGAAALVGGTGLAWAAGRLTDRLHDAGRSDGVLLVGIGCAGALAMCAALGMSLADGLGTAAWLGVYALLGAPTVLAGTALQVITPARMRSQVMATHLLLVNAVALALGPLAVAALTDGMFGAPNAVGMSLAIVVVGAALVALALLALVRARFGALRTETI